jgi:threonine dehydrogenase-like Zn-dependent dehydrogenase
VRAVVWRGAGDVRVEDVPEPRLVEPTDALVRVTTSGLCADDVDAYAIGRREPGDQLGHEVMGVVEDVGPEVAGLRPGDRVVVLLRVPGGQAECVRVPWADDVLVPVPPGPPDDRFFYLCDLLPAAWRAVTTAAVPEGGCLVVVGLGVVGTMAASLARHGRGARVIGVDDLPAHLRRADDRGIETVDASGGSGTDSLHDLVAERTGGRAPDAVIHAPGGADLVGAMALVRPGGTVAVASACGGSTPEAVTRCAEHLLAELADGDPIGVEELATYRLPLSQAPEAYAVAGRNRRGSVKVLFDPALAG